MQINKKKKKEKFTCEPKTTICGNCIESEPTVLNTSCNLLITGINASIFSFLFFYLLKIISLTPKNIIQKIICVFFTSFARLLFFFYRFFLGYLFIYIQIFCNAEFSCQLSQKCVGFYLGFLCFL